MTLPYERTRSLRFGFEFLAELHMSDNLTPEQRHTLNDRGDVFRWPAIDQVFRQSVLVFILEKVDRRVGRNGRDGVLVHQLRRASLAFEQNTEIVEPGHDALEFNAVHKEHGQGCFPLPHGVEENVLQVLFFVRRHGYSEPSLLGPCLTFNASSVQ